MILNPIFLNSFLVLFIGLIVRVSHSKSSARFEEKIVLKSNFKDDVFTIDMSYANETVNILGHALTYDVKKCMTTMESFAPHCVKRVQNKWPKADHKYQRIPEFYFDATANRNFTYTLDFGTGSPLFEDFKCCIIYDLLDCIHTEFKTKCYGLSFAPVDEVIHIFGMQVQGKCNGVHIKNNLFDTINTNNSGERFQIKERKDNKNCKKFLKNKDSFGLKSSICLIFITVLFSLRI